MMSAVTGVILVCALAAPVAAQARPAHVALILDRDSPRFQPLLHAFQNEIKTAVLNRALADSSVAVVVTLGSIGSHLLARAGSPPKPAIAS